MSEFDDQAARQVNRYGRALGSAAGTPGRTTLTARMPPSARAIARAVMAEMNAAPAAQEQLVARAASTSGHALPAPLRARFEDSLGADLGGVRVHADAAAADASAALGARAYATGQDVFMGAGQYQPETADGAWLLAHEVAHTVQQRGAAPGPQTKLEISEPGDAMETEADAAADAMMGGAAARVARADRALARSATAGAASSAAATPSPAVETLRHVIARMTSLEVVRAAYERLVAQSTGAPEDRVVVELNGSYPMARRDLWAVLLALEERQRQLSAASAIPSASGPARGDGAGSYASGAVAGADVAPSGEFEAAENPLEGPGMTWTGRVVHGLEIGHGAFEIAVHGWAAFSLSELVMGMILVEGLETVLTMTGYSAGEFPGWVDQHAGPQLTRNIGGFAQQVTTALRGGRPTGPHASEAAAYAAHVLAQMRAQHPDVSLADLQANLRETELLPQVTAALLPAFRAAADEQAANLVREHHRPDEEMVILAQRFRRRVEAAAP